MVRMAPAAPAQALCALPTSANRKNYHTTVSRSSCRPSRTRQLPRSTLCCAAQSVAAWDSGFFGSLQQHLWSFYKFTRPHTMLGTLLSVCSVSVMALNGSAWDGYALRSLGVALASALLANVSIVGLNQCFDVKIDRVNKPYLPLASGEWTMAIGWSVVWITGIMAMLTASMAGTAPLVATVAGSILLGIVYSADVPLMRWKRHPVAAAGCILAVRAVFVQLGFWTHMRVGGALDSLAPSGPLLFMTFFMAFFSVVIALFKDIPDVRGDAQSNTRTASVRFGVERVFWTCIWMLTVAYASAAGYICWSCYGLGRVLGVLLQTSFAGLLWQHAKQTDLSQHGQVVGAYMFVWKLFYAQYLVLPLLQT